jgi:hypothetical protein
MAIVYNSNFSSKNITITVPKLLQNGSKQSYLNYSGDRLVMQSAVSMTTPFGLNVADQYGPTQYSVDLSFRGVDQRTDLKQFMDVLSELDEYMISEGVKNSKLWFKADLSRDVVKAFYTPTLKYSKDKEGNTLPYPPTIKMKLRRINDQFDTKFYDVKGTPYKDVPVEDLLAKGAQLTAIMECGGVWFAGSKFGLTWRAKQLAIHQMPQKMGDFAFQGLSTEVEDDAAFVPSAAAAPAPSAPAPSAPAAPVAPAASSVLAAMMPQAQAKVEASEEVKAQDDEEEDGEDMEPVPPPKPVIKKKMVVKK